MSSTNRTVNVQVSRAILNNAIGRIPQEAQAGGDTAAAMMTRCGLVVLERIKRAFVIKARGGTDEAGERWVPLSPKTIAYSRRGRTGSEKKRGNRPSQALNRKQQDRWWDLYRQGLAMFNGNKGSAAKRAWGIVKREGAVTLLDKYGHRQVEILRDTGLLLNSLSPGYSIDQVFHVARGEVIIGTKRKGAAAHHTGVPGRLPQRRLWPEPRKWPPAWWRDILQEAQNGLVSITEQLIREAR